MKKQRGLFSKTLVIGIITLFSIISVNSSGGIKNNNPPYVPHTPRPMNGKIKVNYTYTFSTKCEDFVNFQIDWGDSSPIEVLNPNPTDVQKAIANHSWDKIGTYSIRARTEDIWGILSDWGELEVTMPRTKIIIYGLLNLFLERFLKMEVFLRIMNL